MSLEVKFSWEKDFSARAQHFEHMESKAQRERLKPWFTSGAILIEFNPGFAYLAERDLRRQWRIITLCTCGHMLSYKSKEEGRNAGLVCDPLLPICEKCEKTYPQLEDIEHPWIAPVSPYYRFTESIHSDFTVATDYLQGYVLAIAASQAVNKVLQANILLDWQYKEGPYSQAQAILTPAFANTLKKESKVLL